MIDFIVNKLRQEFSPAQQDILSLYYNIFISTSDEATIIKFCAEYDGDSKTIGRKIKKLDTFQNFYSVLGVDYTEEYKMFVDKVVEEYNFLASDIDEYSLGIFLKSSDIDRYREYLMLRNNNVEVYVEKKMLQILEDIFRLDIREEHGVFESISKEINKYDKI